LTPKTVLVTGGLGYIGSHTCVALAQAGCRLVIADNLSNSKLAVLARLKELGVAAASFHKVDLRDAAALESLLQGAEIDAVIHFAGLKAVGESVDKPDLYHDNNVGGSAVLLDAMARHGVRRIVFSSSATVYGEPERLPLDESHPLRPQSPYGENKLDIERMLGERSRADPSFHHVSLRYFNPIGAHPSGRLGEDPRGLPNNLMPFVAQVAVGKLPRLRVFGSDYPTVDGTGVRDYIHVMDLAEGHLAALALLFEQNRSTTLNLGTGRGWSVLEMVAAFEAASGRKVPYEILPRRPGDIAACYADPSRAAAELGWTARLGIEAMCRDAWRWQSQNPEGYPG
jgi:UDP-glucose 4-epimerase